MEQSEDNTRNNADELEISGSGNCMGDLDNSISAYLTAVSSKDFRTTGKM